MVSNKILMTVLRHTLTALGGVLVASGYVSGEELETAIGAVLTLVTIGLRAWEIWRAHQRIPAQ